MEKVTKTKIKKNCYVFVKLKSVILFRIFLRICEKSKRQTRGQRSGAQTS